MLRIMITALLWGLIVGLLAGCTGVFPFMFFGGKHSFNPNVGGKHEKRKITTEKGDITTQDERSDNSGVTAVLVILGLVVGVIALLRSKSKQIHGFERAKAAAELQHRDNPALREVMNKAISRRQSWFDRLFVKLFK